ncbi:MAG: FAD-binding protein, partial [Bacteroidota bacterium]
MIKEIELEIYPQNINDAESIRIQAAKKLELDPLEVKGFQVTKRSIDSRSRRPVFRVRGIAFINENPKSIRELIVFNPVKSNKKVIIIGSGPAGLFAAMKLIELGIKPIIVERGKDVQSRRKDLREIQQNGIVNPDSNYCFGEGGAGAYSDGKLYTRSNKRGDVNRILNLFVQHGAQNEIMIDAHPHIVSNVLPKVVQNIRATILESGGEFHFESKVTNLVITDKKISGVIINENIEILGDAVIVATGHSARDI